MPRQHIETPEERRAELARKLVDLCQTKKMLEKEESEIKRELMTSLMAPGDTEMVTITEQNKTFRVGYVYSEVLEFEDVEKVFHALPSRKDFFEVVTISVTKLRNKLGDERIARLATDVKEKRYISVSETKS